MQEIYNLKEMHEMRTDIRKSRKVKKKIGKETEICKINHLRSCSLISTIRGYISSSTSCK